MWENVATNKKHTSRTSKRLFIVELDITAIHQRRNEQFEKCTCGGNMISIFSKCNNFAEGRWNTFWMFIYELVNVFLWFHSFVSGETSQKYFKNWYASMFWGRKLIRIWIFNFGTFQKPIPVLDMFKCTCQCHGFGIINSFIEKWHSHMFAFILYQFLYHKISSTDEYQWICGEHRRTRKKFKKLLNSWKYYR